MLPRGGPVRVLLDPEDLDIDLQFPGPGERLPKPAKGRGKAVDPVMGVEALGRIQRVLGGKNRQDFVAIAFL
ncbi:MAG TPA: hypothetical protein DIT01_19070, partial [Lentisphaeria bacterium]|nr:hypothetical protein [Lentisphaeria bacterium]